MASAIERHIVSVEAELEKVDADRAGVAEEQAYLKAKLAALPDPKKLAAERAQLGRELETCAARLGELDAEQKAFHVQLDALRKVV